MARKAKTANPTNPNLTRIGLYPQQAEFFDCQKPVRAFIGGIGSGKSFAGAYDLLERAKPRRLYMVVAPTYKMLKDASWRSFQECGRILNYIQARNKTDFAFRLKNGAEVIFRSADEPDRLRGPNLSGVWMDEASLQSEEAYQILIGRLREAGEQGWLSATFTPRGKSHWTFRVFGQDSEDIAVFHATTKDNPFLPEEFERGLRRQYTSALASQELGGVFMDFDGMIFQRHWFSRFADAAPAGMQLCRAWDKAGSAGKGDWSVGCLMGYDARTGLFHVKNVLRGQWSSDARNRVMRQTAELDGHEVEIFVEQEGGSGGKESAEYSVKLLAGYNVHVQTSTGEKRVRAQPYAAQCEAGNLVLAMASWNQDFIDEHCAFTGESGGVDDQVDAASQAFNRLALNIGCWDFSEAKDEDGSMFDRTPAGVGLDAPEEGWEDFVT